MNLCGYPNPVQTIDIDDYLGLSLFTINSNFQVLKEGSCFIDDRYSTSQIQYSGLNVEVVQLSSFSKAIAYAEVSFDCTRNAAGNVNSGNNNRFIYTSYNITSVTKNSNGNYTINFNSNFGANRYAVIGSTSSDNLVTPLSSGYVTASTTINIRDIDGVLSNPDYVSIVIFRN